MSNSISPDELTAELVKQGMVRPDAAPFVSKHRVKDRPWFIGLMLGLAGWLAGAFTLVFAAQLFDLSGATECAIAGMVLLGAAFTLYVVDKESAFFDQFALALSIAGQFAFVGAFSLAVDSEAGTALLAFVMQCLLLVVMPNRTAKLLAAVFACISWALAMRFWLWDPHPFGSASSVPSVEAVIGGWCLAWLPMLVASWVLIASEAQWMASGLRRFLRPLLIGMLLSLAVSTLITSPTESFSFWGWHSGQRARWLMAWPLLSLFCALFAGFCAFRIRHNALLGAAIAGALLYVMNFYFVLGGTLLTKSAVMVVMGAVCFAGSVMLGRKDVGAPR